MATWLLTNPRSGAADQLDAIRPALKAAGIGIHTPDGPRELRGMLRDARQDCDLLIIAGGDGTVHRIVNTMPPDFAHPPLALLPLGTGNDLARTLSVPTDPEAALALALDAAPRPLDLLEVRTGGQTLFCINVCAGGFSGDVSESVGNRTKQAWGPLAYLRGAADSLPEQPGYEVTLRFEGQGTERYAALNLIIANGQTAGGGILVAPAADPRDGWLEVVTVKSAPGPQLVPLVLKLLAGDYTESDLVATRQARAVEVACEHPMLFSLDGELHRMTAARFRVHPGALRFVAGPG